MSFCACAAAAAARTGLGAGLHDGARGLHLLFGLDQLVAGDGAGSFGGLLQAVVGALRGGELRFGLRALGLGGLHLGLGLGDLRLQLGGAQLGQQFALL